MSYDLFVFDVSNAPRDSKACIAWTEEKRAEAEERETWLEAAANSQMQSFYDDIVTTFPDMNGPSGKVIDDSETLAGYEFQPDYIYMDFRWSASEKAAETVLHLAGRHGLGFYDLNDLVVFPA